jgi:hypothetical protein
MSRRRRIFVALLLIVCGSSAGIVAYRRFSVDQRFLGSWREVSGGAFGPRRALTFLPDGTIHDAAWNEQGFQTGEGISWQWWTSGEDLFLGGYTPPATTQSRLTTFLNTTFQELYRYKHRLPQGSPHRILEIDARRMVLEQRHQKGDDMESRQLVFDRIR